jgi:hypothetical protein
MRPIVASVLLIAAAFLTWSTIEELRERRTLRTDLAELGHIRYDLLNADHWVAKITPILQAQIDQLDLTQSKDTLRPMVQSALYRLLDQVKENMSKPAPQGSTPAAGGGGFFSMAGNPMVVNMIVGALKPKVPEFTDIVMKELGRPESREAVKKYITQTLTEGAKTTFGNLDWSVYNGILKEYDCQDGPTCRQKLADRVHEEDARIQVRYLGALGATLLAFVLLLPGTLRPAGAIVLLLFCAVLLLGGILTPMLEVEAKFTSLKMTFLGQPVAFGEQILYFQSKSVLEVFKALMEQGKPEMYLVGVLVLMFSVVFPILKLIASTVALFRPVVLRNPVVRFFALESSKWSMADVMALAIFMAFVAFNGLIANTMKGLLQTGADIAIPTNSSIILPGYYIFIGFCLASLFLSRKLSKSLLLVPAPAPDRRSEEVQQES